jgi:hypothetical protein
MLILHGVAGGLDELVIAVVAIGVLWLAVKFAGRKPAEDAEEAESAATEEDVRPDPAASPR